MALTTAYLTSMKNIAAILEAVRIAGVPPKFTYEFLKSLGFTSSNDRAILKVLKGLEFLDQGGVPTERYRQFRDKTKSARVLAEALREAYSDLFLANENAQGMPLDKLRGFFATKTGKGNRVVEQMASTFKALGQLADFNEQAGSPLDSDAQEQESIEEPFEAAKVLKGELDAEFHYNIQIHLPATRDITVYSAIFKALRDNFS